MPPLVDLRVIIALDFTVGFGRDHSGCTARVEVLQQPSASNALSASSAKRNAADQRRDTFHIMRLSRQQQEAHELSERIHHRHNVGPLSHMQACVAVGLSLAPHFVPVAFWWT